MYNSRGSGALAAVLCLFLLAMVAAVPAGAAAPGIDFSCDPPTAAATPTICLPGGLGEDEAAPLAAGEGPVLFAALVVNNGPSVSDAAAVVTLPGGLVSPGDDMVRRVELPIPVDGGESDFLGTPLPCTRSDDDATITCRAGALAHGDKILILVGVAVSPTAKVGTSATFGVALGPVAPDTYATTTVHGTIDIVGTAHLQVSVAPGDVTAVVGHSVTLRVRIHNAGSDAAAEATGFGLLFPRGERNLFKTHFEITNAPDLGAGGGILIGAGAVGASVPDSAAGRLRAGVAQNRHRAVASRLEAQARTGTAGSRSDRAATPSARSTGTPFALWPLGTIAPRATVNLSVRLAAVRPGIDLFLFSADSDTADLSCTGEVPGPCEQDAAATLRALAAPKPAAGPAGGGGRLTDTGAPTTIPALELGLLALVVGAALTAAGRTRRPSAQHRR